MIRRQKHRFPAGRRLFAAAFSIPFASCLIASLATAQAQTATQSENSAGAALAGASGANVTLDLQVSYAFKAPKLVDPVFAKDSKGVCTQVSATSSESGSIWQKMLWGRTLRAGVNNVFDRYPTYDPAQFNDNYDTSTYSIRNRFLYVGINKKF